MRGLISVVIAAGLLPAVAANGEFIFQDSLQKDTGWANWNSTVAFGEKGLSAFGVVSRKLEWLPGEFDAMVTIDASKSIIWGFGVAGSFSDKTGFSGIALVADRQDKPGVTFGRWENDTIVDSIWIDAEATKMFDGLHDLRISVRDSMIFAGIDGVTVAKMAYDSKPAGSDIVLASFAEGDTYFRDLSVVARIPSQGGLMAAVPLIALAAMRRRR